MKEHKKLNTAARGRLCWRGMESLAVNRVRHGVCPVRYAAAKSVVRAASTDPPADYQLDVSVGVITLPGMMIDQILAGMDPLEAGKYQILLLFPLSADCGSTGWCEVGAPRASHSKCVWSDQLVGRDLSNLCEFANPKHFYVSDLKQLNTYWVRCRIKRSRARCSIN